MTRVTAESRLLRLSGSKCSAENAGAIESFPIGGWDHRYPRGLLRSFRVSPRERPRRRRASKVVVTETAAVVSQAVSEEHGVATAKTNNAICTEAAAGALAVDKADPETHDAAAAEINRAVSDKVDAAAAAMHTVFSYDVSSATTVGDGKVVFAYVDADAAAGASVAVSAKRVAAIAKVDAFSTNQDALAAVAVD